MLTSITRRLHTKCVNRIQFFFLLIFIVIVNEFIATNWMIFFIWVLTHALQWNWWDFVYLQTKKKDELCVEMLSIERERLTPRKREGRKKITHKVFGLLALPASLLRISYQILTQVQYESVLSSFSLCFYFCCEIRGLSSN